MSDQKRDIDQLRREIAELDAQLLGVLEARARIAIKIGELRKDQPPALPLAERSAVHALLERASGDLPADSLREIFRDVLAACFTLEQPARVAYLGPEGGVAHALARAHFGVSGSYIAAETTSGVFEGVARRRADFALVPYETHSEGPVQTTIVALTASELRIVAVIEVSPNLHLLNRTGNAADIEKIYATPADRALSERSLAEMTKASILDVKSPLVACQLAAEDHGAAALASEAFGTQHGLTVARPNVRDRAERIRYAVVGTRPSSRTGEDLTALVFSVRDGPGALLDVLKGFAEHGINLTKIHSRPDETEGWSYLFFLEVAGHVTERALITALEEVKRRTKFFKVLGSYPVR